MSVWEGRLPLMSSKTEIVIEGLRGLDWFLYIKLCFRALSFLSSYNNYMYLSWGQFHLLYPLKEF